VVPPCFPPISRRLIFALTGLPGANYTVISQTFAHAAQGRRSHSALPGDSQRPLPLCRLAFCLLLPVTAFQLYSTSKASICKDLHLLVLRNTNLFIGEITCRIRGKYVAIHSLCSHPEVAVAYIKPSAPAAPSF